MIKKSKIVNFDEFQNLNSDIKNKSIFLDIETTGLSPAQSKIIMIGVIYNKNNHFFLEQYFSDVDSEEKVLINILNLIKKSEYIITFNGISFDLKFIKKRAKSLGLNLNLKDKYLIDLYKIVLKNKSYFKVKNYKLKTIEKFLGLNRIDAISGKDFIKIYNAYRLNPKKEYKEIMFQHNFEDVLSLPFLFNFLNSLDNKTEVKYKNSDIYLFFDKDSVVIKKDYINIKIHTFKINCINTIVENFNYKINWNKKNGIIALEIFSLRGKLKNGKILNYIKLSEVFKNNIKKTNKYNISDDFLILYENNFLLKKNLFFLIENLFNENMIP